MYGVRAKIEQDGPGNPSCVRISCPVSISNQSEYEERPTLTSIHAPPDGRLSSLGRL